MSIAKSMLIPIIKEADTAIKATYKLWSTTTATKHDVEVLLNDVTRPDLRFEEGGC